MLWEPTISSRPNSARTNILFVEPRCLSVASLANCLIFPEAAMPHSQLIKHANAILILLSSFRNDKVTVKGYS